MSRLSDYTLGMQLGRGTYGCVYECTDGNGRKKAIKCIPMKGKYKHVIEASIMATYKHPHIAASDSIFIENDTLYIVQKLAKIDLAVLTRGNPISLEKIKAYTYSIAKAIYFLHERKIVHGDVKANNVLLYDDDMVKLTDFSLSAIMVKKSYNHGVGTQSHRPPESYNKENWSYPIDMWALGCTVYEIAYGKNIFPKQVQYQGFSSMDMTWLSILDWITTNEKIRLNTAVGGRKISLASIPFERVKHPTRYYTTEYTKLNEFMMSLMKYNPKDRLTARDVLLHPFLTGVNVRDNPRVIKKHKKTPVSAKDIMLIDQYQVVEPQRSISIEILSICYNMPNMNITELCRSCVFVSYVLTKTVIPGKLDGCVPERLLSYLGYSFHEVVNCVGN